MDGQKRIIDGSSIHKDFNPNKSLKLIKLINDMKRGKK